MEEMPSQSMPVQRLKVAILPLDLACSGSITQYFNHWQVSQEKAEWMMMIEYENAQSFSII
jgi:hypothetical protein